MKRRGWKDGSTTAPFLSTASSEHSMGEPPRVHRRLYWNAKWRYGCWGLGDPPSLSKGWRSLGGLGGLVHGFGRGTANMRPMGTAIDEAVFRFPKAEGLCDLERRRRLARYSDL